MNNFRKNHILKILSQYEESVAPLDAMLGYYFKQNKSIGSKDRKEIAESIYFLIRNLSLIDYGIDSPIDWRKRLEAFLNQNFISTLSTTQLPERILYSFPKEYWEFIVQSLGREKAIEFCKASHTQAPITIRANPLLLSRDDLFEKLRHRYQICPAEHSPFAIHLKNREALFSSEEFKKGYFEMQDEGSQLVALEMEVKPGDRVLDFCAGSGGKTLAFAHRMQGKGQIFIHDIRSKVLDQARLRMRRAKVQNYQIMYDFNSFMKKPFLFDWVLLDVPCSGSGTLRRNPDQKWKFKKEMIENLVLEQRAILNKVFPYVKNKGKILYATCSVFPEENEHQISYFLKNYPLQPVKKPLATFPQEGAMDGFFAATLEKSEKKDLI